MGKNPENYNFKYQSILRYIILEKEMNEERMAYG